MTVDIEVIPISHDSDEFYATILRIGSIRILLDCGWTERMNVDAYSQLSSDVFSNLDLVLLSHYSLNHVGALPYLLFRNWGRKLRLMSDFAGPRIVATEAVRRLGELSLASLHEDIDKVKNVCVSDESYTMTLEDIVSAFGYIQPVQFNETITVKDLVTVTCQPAGHLMGGAYFVITVGSQRIVYATDYSLSAGKAVSGLSIGPAKSCSVLITDAAASEDKSDLHINSTSNFLSSCKQTLRSGGTVLIPIDSTGDVLDLLLILEQAYSQDAALQVYPVVFVSPLGDVVLDQVKTRMEWMNGHVLHEFEESVNFTAHPFLLQHIQLCSNLNDFIEKYNKNSPKIILATSPNLDIGDSRELFVRYSYDSNNLVILPGDRPPLEGSLAHQLLARYSPGTSWELMVSQYVKSPLSDEQLRQVYRECLEKEAQDDELRRRRIRERMPQQTASAAPSSAAAVPVDLIRGLGTYEGDSAGGNFFRPQLFAAQTVASGAVLASQRQVSDYGEQLNQIEVDTWRAHAEMSDLGAAREAAAEQASMVKAEKMVKGEVRIKGDMDDKMVKGELGVTGATAGESFDWRRDLQVRFGEPQKIEVRERMIKVACKVRTFNSRTSSAHHRREFITSVAAESVIVLPSRNLHDIQLVSLMVRSEGKNIYTTQEDVVPSLEGEQGKPIPIPVSLSISAEKKWIHIDPQVVLPFKGMLDSSDVRIARLQGTELVGPVAAPPDLIQVPSGEFIDYTIAPQFSKRQKSSQTTGPAILVNTKPFRLTDFANFLRKSLPGGSVVEFRTSSDDGGRVLSIQALGGQVVVMRSHKSQVEVLGTPSPCFYKVRELLYSSSVVI